VAPTNVAERGERAGANVAGAALAPPVLPSVCLLAHTFCLLAHTEGLAEGLLLFSHRLVVLPFELALGGFPFLDLVRERGALAVVALSWARPTRWRRPVAVVVLHLDASP
jgi:hypothetical protein